MNRNELETEESCEAKELKAALAYLYHVAGSSSYDLTAHLIGIASLIIDVEQTLDKAGLLESKPNLSKGEKNRWQSN